MALLGVTKAENNKLQTYKGKFEMLLIAEIALAFWARKRGWGNLAFLPIAVGMLCGLFAGLFLGMSGMEQGAVMLAALGIDGLVVVTLIAMGSMGRQSAPQKPTPNSLNQSMNAIQPVKMQANKRTAALPYR